MKLNSYNGIYILKTKDQYRVAHLLNIDNISQSVIDGDWYKNINEKRKYVPTRIVEMFGDCKYTRNELTAFKIAHNWANSLPVCECGVNVITYNKTWKHILQDAQAYAKKEINYINNNINKYIKYFGCFSLRTWEATKLPILQRIADGVYFNEWINRNKNIMEKNNETNI